MASTMYSGLALLVLAAVATCVSAQSATPTPPPTPTPVPTPAPSCAADIADTCWLAYQNCYDIAPQNASHICTCFTAANKCTYQAGCWTSERASMCVNYLDAGVIQDCPVSVCDPGAVPTPTITATPPPNCASAAQECATAFTDCTTTSSGNQGICNCTQTYTNCLYSKNCWIGVNVDMCEQAYSQLGCHDLGFDPCNPSTSAPTPSPNNCEGPKIAACGTQFEHCQDHAGNNTSEMCPCMAAASVCLEAAGCYTPDIVQSCQNEARRLGCTNVCMALPTTTPTPTPTTTPPVCDYDKLPAAADEFETCRKGSMTDKAAFCACYGTYIGQLDAAHCWQQQVAKQCYDALKNTGYCADPQSICKYTSGISDGTPTPSAKTAEGPRFLDTIRETIKQTAIPQK